MPHPTLVVPVGRACPPRLSFLVATLPSSSTTDDDHDIPSLLKCNSPALDSTEPTDSAAATGKIEQAVGAAVRSSNELPVPAEREERQEGREGGRERPAIA